MTFKHKVTLNKVNENLALHYKAKQFVHSTRFKNKASFVISRFLSLVLRQSALTITGSKEHAHSQ